MMPTDDAPQLNCGASLSLLPRPETQHQTTRWSVGAKYPPGRHVQRL